MSLIEQFRKLHKTKNILLLGNVWNTHTALQAEELGFAAVGTSSHGIALSLGYQDGEDLPVETMFWVIESIVKKIHIPVSVDFEAGYSNKPEVVAEHVKRLFDMGVVGINLEDGKVNKGTRSLGDASLLAEKIKAIKESSKMFVNARTDTYTTKHKDALAESIQRGLLYKEAGADCLFVPLIERVNDISEVSSEVGLPLNVFITGNLPLYKDLKRLGVKRVSFGGKMYDQIASETEMKFKTLLEEESWNHLLK